jgi:hypothetical protein
MDPIANIVLRETIDSTIKLTQLSLDALLDSRFAPHRSDEEVIITPKFKAK